jgi:hypothetical protein
MYKIAIIATVLAPALAAAQVTASAKSETATEARAGRSSVQASSSVDAEVAIAKRRGLPTRPIERRAAEGRAKGAAEAQVALAARSVRMNLETAHSAMVRAGRARPSDEEVEQGAVAVERGYTSAQVEAVVKSAPSDRSLVVAFDVLTKLATRGIETGKAVATVQSRLEARATDTQISALAGAGMNGSLGATDVAGASAAAGANAAVTATRGGSSVAGGVTGAVGGVIKP